MCYKLNGNDFHEQRIRVSSLFWIPCDYIAYNLNSRNTMWWFQLQIFVDFESLTMISYSSKLVSKMKEILDKQVELINWNLGQTRLSFNETRRPQVCWNFQNVQKDQQCKFFSISETRPSLVKPARVSTHSALKQERLFPPFSFVTFAFHNFNFH